jgi:hypothetical protein
LLLLLLLFVILPSISTCEAREEGAHTRTKHKKAD